MAKVKPTYTEPNDYIPKEIRKKYKLGEYAESAAKSSGTNKNAPKKTTKK